VNGDRISDLGGGNQHRHVQVTLSGGCRPDTHRLIRQQDVFETAIGVGMDGNGLDTQFAAGTQDSQGNFATVGDDNFI